VTRLEHTSNAIEHSRSCEAVKVFSFPFCPAGKFGGQLELTQREREKVKVEAVHFTGV